MLNTLRLCTILFFKIKTLATYPMNMPKKKTDGSTVFFPFWGSALVNSFGKKLVKLTPGVNFINVL